MLYIVYILTSKKLITKGKPMTKIYGKTGFVERTIEIETSMCGKYKVVEWNGYGDLVAVSPDVLFDEALRIKDRYIERATYEVSRYV
jgi:hypothetical protein